MSASPSQQIKYVQTFFCQSLIPNVFYHDIYMSLKKNFTIAVGKRKGNNVCIKKNLPLKCTLTDDRNKLFYLNISGGPEAVTN